MYKEISRRIKQIRIDFCNDSNIEFAKKINVSRQAANNYVRDGYNVGKKVIDQILLSFPEINTSWLLTGEGNMLNSDNLISRIKAIMSYYDLNTTQFAEKTGISQANLSSMLNGNRVIGEGVINKIIISFENIDKHWLLTGEGNMFKDPEKLSEYNAPDINFKTGDPQTKYGHPDVSYQEKYIQQLETENKRLIELLAEKDAIIEGMKNGSIVFVDPNKTK